MKRTVGISVIDVDNSVLGNNQTSPNAGIPVAENTLKRDGRRIIKIFVAVVDQSPHKRRVHFLAIKAAEARGIVIESGSVVGNSRKGAAHTQGAASQGNL